MDSVGWSFFILGVTDFSWLSSFKNFDMELMCEDFGLDFHFVTFNSL